MCENAKAKMLMLELACSTVFVCFNYSASLSSDDFSSFKNSAILSLKMNRPALQTFTYCIKNKSKSCDSQVQSPSHRLTGKSEQISF